MKFVDVHCHLTHKYFTENDTDNFEDFLKRAEKAGVKAMVCSGVNPKSNREVLELAKKYPQIKASLGLYPIDLIGKQADEDVGIGRNLEGFDIDKELKFIEKNKDKIVSIGEIGMDFHWVKKEDYLEIESENFRKIIRFAKELKKPIVIHSRKAEKECLDIMEEELPNNEIAVVNHCFGGKKKYIQRGADLGYYFSVPAVIKRLQHFQTLVKIVPIEQLLTETDSPYLSPKRVEGRMNEPSFVPDSIKMIAKIKEISEKEASEQIWKNYEKVFGKNELITS